MVLQSLTSIVCGKLPRAKSTDISRVCCRTSETQLGTYRKCRLPTRIELDASQVVCLVRCGMILSAVPGQLCAVPVEAGPARCCWIVHG